MDRALHALTVVDQTVKLLPTEADSVASWLQAEGVRGKQGNSSQCPLAKLMQLKLEAAGLDGVYAFASSYSIELDGDGFSVNVDVPDHLHRFVSAFDSGEYPDLVEAETQSPFDAVTAMFKAGVC